MKETTNGLIRRIHHTLEVIDFCLDDLLYYRIEEGSDSTQAKDVAEVILYLAYELSSMRLELGTDNMELSQKIREILTVIDNVL